jgi:BlaI family penicillinase repressor
MGKAPRISDAEWEVMQVVWDKAPLTSNDIADQLAEDHDWDVRTIKTMLNRLVKKGALKFKTQGRSYLYSPTVTQDTCVKEETDRFLGRVFRGSTTPLIAHFIENAQLSKEEIGELRHILSRKTK